MCIFSVIVPTHNRIPYLREALHSVQVQTFDDFECLVISDLPSEFFDVNELVESLNDSRFRFLSGRRPGANASRNLGVEEAKGKILAFLDDDDLWRVDNLELRKAAHECADFVFSDVVRRIDNGSFCYDITPLIVEHKVLSLSALVNFERCPATSSCVSIRQDSVKNLRWDESLLSYQDWDLWYQLLKEGCSVNFIADCPVFFRVHKGVRTSKGLEKRLNALFYLREKAGVQFSPDRLAAQVRREIFSALSDIPIHKRVEQIRQIEKFCAVHGVPIRLSRLRVIMTIRGLSMRGYWVACIVSGIKRVMNLLSVTVRRVD